MVTTIDDFGTAAPLWVWRRHPPCRIRRILEVGGWFACHDPRSGAQVAEQPYPPEPWRMTGQAYVSVWRLPSAQLPAIGSTLKPVVLRGSGLVCTAWVDYQPGGELSYHELLSAVVVRDGRSAAVTITDIWVDSRASLAGGRELWGIPKQLADFDMTHSPEFLGDAHDSDGLIASAVYRRLLRAPFRVPSRARVLRPVGQEIRRSPVRMSARLELAATKWAVNADGPLGYLHDRKPLINVAVRDFRMRFGHG